MRPWIALAVALLGAPAFAGEWTTKVIGPAQYSRYEFTTLDDSTSTLDATHCGAVAFSYADDVVGSDTTAEAEVLSCQKKDATQAECDVVATFTGDDAWEPINSRPGYFHVNVVAAPAGSGRARIDAYCALDFGGSGGGTGSGLATYVETTSPTVGSTPGNTGDQWFDTTNHTQFVNEDGLTEAWSGEPIVMTAVITAPITITTAEDTFFGRVPWDATVTNVDCITIGGTSAQATVSEATSAGVTSNVTEATLTCDSNAENTSSIDEPVLDRGDQLRLDIGTVTGNVTSLSVTVTLKPR